MTAADIIGALILAFALAASGCLDGPSDIEAAHDVAAAVRALGQK